MSRTTTTAETMDLATSAGPIRCHISGPVDGSPVLFLHGFAVSTEHWRNVVPLLDDRYRCIRPELPLGAHPLPARDDADLTLGGLAETAREVLDGLGVREAAVVGNDTGGAVAQSLAVRYPERVARLVLTPCDAFDNFPPPPFKLLSAVARVPGAALVSLALLPVPGVQRLPMTFGRVTKRPLPRELLRAYAAPALHDRRIRHDLRKVLAAFDAKHTRAVAAQLSSYDRPALVVWDRDDPLFPPAHAERLAELLPQASVVWIDDSWGFIPEDNPGELARVLGEFFDSTAW